jgi:hypothetical protein
MLTLPVFSPDLSQIRVSRPLVFCAVFCRFVLLSFFFFCCIVCPSLIYGFWLLLLRFVLLKLCILCSALEIIVCSFVPFSVVLSVLLGFTASNYPFGILKNVLSESFHMLTPVLLIFYVFFCLAYHMSLRCEFHVVISVTISA